MISHDFEQGSDAWLAHRNECWNAGDAAAMLSCSPNETRSELLARLHSGVHKEFSGYVQEHVIDPGHAFEDNARALAEEAIGEDLGRVVGSLDVGLSRPLGASFDGITFMHDTVWEHKSINEGLRYTPWDEGNGSHLPKCYRVQMEQQLLVSGAERALFMASKWKPDGTPDMVRQCWYVSDAALRAEIIAGWKLLEADLATYVPPAPFEKVIAEPVESLPAPVIKVTGELALQDNFKVFENRLREFLENKLIREPRTDEDFVNLDAQIREMKRGREALKASKAQMLAQVQPIDQASKTADMLDSLLQQNVSMAEKLLTAEKDRRKGEIVAGGVKAFDDHIAGLNARLGKPYMPKVPTDFGGVIRGLKSLTSMEDKVSSELARAKIAASEIADRIEVNLKFMRENAAQHAFLFADTAAIVLKASDDLQSLVSNRIAEHEKAEEARREKERERIRAEEQAKLQREAEEAARAKEAEEAEAARKAQEAIAAAATPAPAAAPAPAPARRPMSDREWAALPAGDRELPHYQVYGAPSSPHAVDEKPTMKLGEINMRLGYIVTADFLASLGFEAHIDRNARLYRESDWPRICRAIAEHTMARAEAVAA